MGFLEMGVPGYSICLPAPVSKEGLDSHWRIPSLTRVKVYMYAMVQATIQRLSEKKKKKNDRGTQILEIIISTVINVINVRRIYPSKAST